MVLATVVEGHGEVQAVPTLLHRIARHLNPELVIRTPTPFRLPRGQMVDGDRLRSAVRLQAARVGVSGGVLVILDSDDDEPLALERTLSLHVDPTHVTCPVVVVAATREYEAWLLAGLMEATSVLDPETPRDAKREVERLALREKYRETRHQRVLTARLDIGWAASRSASFSRLVDAVSSMADV